MAINSVLGTGLQGIQSGMQGLQKNAEKIAGYGTGEGTSNLGDLAAEMVEMKENELLVQASAKVVETAGRTIGSLLDIQA